MHATPHVGKIRWVSLTALSLVVWLPAAASASFPVGFEVTSANGTPGTDSGTWDVTVHARIVTATGQSRVVSAWTSPGWEIVGPTVRYDILRAADGSLQPLVFSLTATKAEANPQPPLELVVLLHDGTAFPPSITRFAFRVVDDVLVPVPPDVEHDALVVERTEHEALMRFQGVVITRTLGDDGHLREIGVDDLPTELRATLEAAIAERAQRTTTTRSGALDSAPTVASNGASTPSSQGSASNQLSGCNSGGSTTVIACAGLLLLLLLHSTRRRRRRSPTGAISKCVVFVFVTTSIAAASTTAQAQERCAWGFTGWWDSRRIYWLDPTPYVENSYPGFRDQPCNPGLTECFPWQTDCCFTELRGVEVRLIRKLNGVTQAIVDTTTADYNNGLFTVCDSAWSSAYTYSIAIRFGHGSSPPGNFLLAPSSGAPVPYSVAVDIGVLSSGWHFTGLISPNAAGDLTSFSEGLARTWAGASETLLALEAAGETRHRRKFGSANSYDQITIRVSFAPCSEGNCSHACSTSLIRSSLAANPVAHELGHLLHGRVVGCGMFPRLWSFDPHLIFHTSESDALTEGIATFVAALRAFDPQVARTEDVVTQSIPCFEILHENDLVSEFNNVVALWDLIDADGGYTDSLADEAQVTVPALFDALVQLQGTPGSPGQNRTGVEQLLVGMEDACTPPSTPYPAYDELPLVVCPAGQVCDVFGQCVGGKPHGSNLRDWVHHLPNGQTSSVYWRAIQSSHCIGPAKDSPPFNGGYRTTL